MPMAQHPRVVKSRRVQKNVRRGVLMKIGLAKQKRPLRSHYPRPSASNPVANDHQEKDPDLDPQLRVEHRETVGVLIITPRLH